MYLHIMVPLDGSELAECVLPHVNAMARLLKGKEKISLVRVVPPLHLYEGTESSLPPEERKQLEADGVRVAKDYLEQVVTKLNLNQVTVTTEVLSGQAAEKLNEFIENNGVDLIIIATHGRSGIGRWFAGSTADKLIRSASVPVLVVRPPQSPVSPSQD
ncbi:MAG: universal stress protein [Dehalococcoidales bacterium]|jgi:nucleotide-binding universal stress UspA family protein